MQHTTRSGGGGLSTSRRTVIQTAGVVAVASTGASADLGGNDETDEWTPGTEVEDIERIRWRDDGAHLDGVDRIEFRADGGFFGFGGSGDISVSRVSFA